MSELQLILLLILFALGLWLRRVIAERQAHNPEHEAHRVKRQTQNAEPKKTKAEQPALKAAEPQLRPPSHAHMTVTLTNCHHCHNTLYPSREVKSPYVGEDTTRDYFCSDTCYKNALENFLPEHFRHGTTIEDYHEFKTVLTMIDLCGSAYTREKVIADATRLKREWPEQKALYTQWAATDLKSSIRDTYYEMERKESIKRDKGREEELRRAEEQLEREIAQIGKAAQKEAEMQEREWEKDFIAAEKEHEQFLADEAFQESLDPKPIPQNIRFEHTHILGPAGSGKTSLLQQLLMEDFLVPEFPMAIVVIDPKGLMVDRLSRLIAFDPVKNGWLQDRLIVIDPTKEPLPALDLFHQPPLPMTEQQRARVRTQLIETFAYIFSTADAKLTQRQSIPFGYVVRLVFSMGGNIDTLMDILEDNAKERRFFPDMQKLGEQDRGARRFFENDFYTVGFNDTRQQIKTRLYEIISKPELMAMFAAGQNKLSMFDCLQQHKIVLINTAMPQLGATASQLLGRYFIAMTLNAAFARFAIPKKQWTPAYLVIDEFQEFADEEKTPEMLRLAREYNLGITIAHQNMFCAELNDALRNAISTNTSIKYCASPEGSDLSYMARDMRCENDFLKAQTKHRNTAKFACYVRGMGLTHPFVCDVELGGIDQWDKVPEDVHAGFMRYLQEQLKPDPKSTKPQVSLHSPPDVNKPKPSAPEQPAQHQSAPKHHEPPREPSTPTQAPAKSAPTDPHTGDHTEPASKWGDQ